MPTEKKNAMADYAAASMKDHDGHTFEGRVVSVVGRTLVMKNREGKECARTLAEGAQLSRDGTDCQAMELKPGRRIRVTTKKDDVNVALKVESLDKLATFTRSH